MFFFLFAAFLCLKILGTTSGQKTNFCLQQKPQLAKCTGHFYDHMREMKDQGKTYESSGDLRSMKEVDQCLAAEMQKCPEQQRKAFKEIVFTTYGVDMQDSSRVINPNQELCYTVVPEIPAIDVQRLDYRNKRDCTPEDVKRWLIHIQKCLDRRTAKLKEKSLKLKEVTSKRAFRFVELCIHVHKPLPCKPSQFEVFEPLFKEFLANTKTNLLRMVESLKTVTPNVQDAEKCIQQLDSVNMQKCIPQLYEVMKALYSSAAPPKQGQGLEQCAAKALNECKDKTQKIIDYALKSAMGILLPTDNASQGNDTVEICRLTKAIEIGYQECTTNTLHKELESIGYCMESSVPADKRIELQSGLKETEKCIAQYMAGTCYIPDAKLLTRMVEYTFAVISEFLKHHMTQGTGCLKLMTGADISKCVPLAYVYIDTLKKGLMFKAMDQSEHTKACVQAAVKGCPPEVVESVLRIFSHVGRVTFMPPPPPLAQMTIITEEKIVRIERDVGYEFEENSGVKLQSNVTEDEMPENTPSDFETETEFETAQSEVYSVKRTIQEVQGEPANNTETLRDDFTTNGTLEKETDTEVQHTTIQEPEVENENRTRAKEEFNTTEMPDANITTKSRSGTTRAGRTNLLHLEECDAASFRNWINKYHECFVKKKYHDGGRDLNNIIIRILHHISDCLEYSLDKRCFPQWLQLEEFFREVVYQAKDYADMYLDQIKKERGKIVDLRCIENFTAVQYRNCTENIFKFLDYLRNHLVNSNGFSRHAENTVSCLASSYELCTETSKKKLVEVVEVLLDLSNGTLRNHSVLLTINDDQFRAEKKSLGTQIAEFFQTAAEYIAKPFVWLYNAIKSLFHW